MPQFKKSGGIFCEGNRLEAYRFINKYHTSLGIRWMLQRLAICPNAYYNCRKHQKADYYTHKEKVLEEINTIYHAHKGAQYTSKAFIDYCESVHVTQSMSKAGYPYDNAPMERYFNTLKNECTNLYAFKTEEPLYQTVEEFACVTYNHVRPHSYNGYRTPYQARIAA